MAVIYTLASSHPAGTPGEYRLGAQMFFAYFDGDDIGSTLELLLLDDHIQEARDYSNSIIQAFEVITFSLVGNFEANVIIGGGDDLLVCFPTERVSRVDIEELRQIFFQACGRSVSVGSGTSAAEAVNNLRRAKLMGKNQLVMPSRVAH